MHTRFTFARRALILLGLLAALGLVVSACGGGGSSSKSKPEPKLSFPATAPKFDAKYLTALPKENWITNGGTINNDRYSPLDQINSKNVDQLKGLWTTHLKTALPAKYSAESQPLVYDGVMYVSSGQDDVLALDVETGAVKWKYAGNLDPKISTVCCGWLNRGVALGDGMVYLGRLDGFLVALDQATGKEVWRTKVVDWLKDGSGITAAPLYYDGMLFTGITGGEFGVRGRLTAFDAKTGKELWRFYTTAGPEDPVGGKTWTGDSYKTGGAPVWQTPSLDPKLGMVYFTTGNANPDTDGSERAGDNLYSASFVALDYKTGTYKWHFQTVHHDIWDYDQPSPTILYTAHVHGKDVPAIAEASKTGWLYALDRKTGKSIWDVKEQAVPQDAYNKTAATQPIPQYAPFAPHDISDASLAAVKKIAASNPAAKGLPVVKGTEMYTPPTKGKIVVTAPGPAGGTNWPPSSYNHESNLIYVCSGSGVAGLNASGTPDVTPGAFRVGSILAVLPFGGTPGHLTAIDGDTGEIAWNVDFDDTCYSGSVTTAGNLVFVGRNKGELEAYSADKGKKLWSFQTGAGANDTVTVFQHKGKEYVALYAGGNSLAATVHGDSMWVFSLDGKLEQAAGGGKGQGTAHAGEDQTPPATTTTKTADLTNGETVFQANCSGCHGLSGGGGNGGPNLEPQNDVQHNIKQVTNGGGGMPAFGDQLSDQDILDVASWVAKNAHP
jgi:alcohol dehydrogenase (cytochrome c)